MNDRIPLVDLKAAYARHKDAIDAAMRDVIENTRFIQGKEVKDFDAERYDAWRDRAYLQDFFANCCGS